MSLRTGRRVVGGEMLKIISKGFGPFLYSVKTVKRGDWPTNCGIRDSCTMKLPRATKTTSSGQKHPIVSCGTFARLWLSNPTPFGTRPGSERPTTTQSEEFRHDLPEQGHLEPCRFNPLVSSSRSPYLWWLPRRNLRICSSWPYGSKVAWPPTS